MEKGNTINASICNRGEKCSTATKTIRSDNESVYGSKDSAERVIGRKVDVLVEHDQFELSASEWMTFGSGRGLLDKQHNKNVRVNACILLQHLRLPYTENQNNDGMHVLTMEWSGM